MARELGNITFERTFESIDPKGNASTIKLRVGLPYLYADSDSFTDWRCPVQLIGIGSEKVREGCGIDAIDALLTSLRLADVWLKHSRLKITWLGQDDLGLSLAPPFELTDEERASSDSGKPFEDAFEDFFRNYKPKRGDASE